MVLPTIRPRNLWNLCSNLYKRWFALDFCPNYCVILISYSINVRGNWRQCYGSALQYVEDQVPVIQLSLRKGAFYSSLQTLPYQWLNIICMLRNQLGKLNKQIVLHFSFSHIKSGPANVSGPTDSGTLTRGGIKILFFENLVLFPRTRWTVTKLAANILQQVSTKVRVTSKHCKNQLFSMKKIVFSS